MSLKPRNFITQRAFDNAENKFGYIEISLTNTPISVKGILKENFSLSTEANYDNIFSVSDKFEGVRKTMDFALGASFLNTGQWTRKYYKGGSYMKITPKFRVVDYDGNADPLRTAFILINASLPNPGKYDRILDDMKDLSMGQITKKYEPIVKKDINDLKNVGQEALAGNFMQSIKSFGNLLAGQLGNSPNPVSVKISNFFFWEEMVIDSVNVEFSKEMIYYNDVDGSSGPLYVDIEATLSSREVATKGRTGLESFDKRFIVVPGNGGT